MNMCLTFQVYSKVQLGQRGCNYPTTQATVKGWKMVDKQSDVHWRLDDISHVQVYMYKLWYYSLQFIDPFDLSHNLASAVTGKSESISVTTTLSRALASRNCIMLPLMCVSHDYILLIAYRVWTTVLFACIVIIIILAYGTAVRSYIYDRFLLALTYHSQNHLWYSFVSDTPTPSIICVHDQYNSLPQ